MTPSARVEIADRGGFLSGVLYTELPDLMRELYEQGKAAIAYHTGSDLIVGESDPSVPDRWWGRDDPPTNAPPRRDRADRFLERS